MTMRECPLPGITASQKVIIVIFFFLIGVAYSLSWSFNCLYPLCIALVHVDFNYLLWIDSPVQKNWTGFWWDRLRHNVRMLRAVLKRVPLSNIIRGAWSGGMGVPVTAYFLKHVLNLQTLSYVRSGNTKPFQLISLLSSSIFIINKHQTYK